ncbi:RHS repeat protein [Streptomyces sp. KK5PA1]|uniref:RHS repeat protein n=1 Tax=Actinacidiphila acididurans TaxID=2784346 RepID=A0ABS2TRS2_9ACTN|nr:RHS repeat protein [Actinacidiphila acididurans]MBM9506034.1 RHS repeat protein [Actinacidiphila acididurans]
MERPDGTVVRIAYDARRLPAEVVAPDGATWRQAFDARGNRTEVTDAAGATTRFAYDDDGRATSVTNPAGHTTLVRCDEAGLPVEVIDPLGAATRYRRDAFGRIIDVTDPLGNTTGYKWSVEGRPLSRTEPDGARHAWDYDAEGNTTRHTDPSGAVTALTYTHFGLATDRTDPDGARYTFVYDTELRLVQVTQPQGLTWNYRHDAAGRVIGETDFDGRSLTYTYDAAGRLTTRTNGLGQTIAYHLDALGRVVRKDANGAVTQYAYDRAGRLLSARDGITELIRGYDPVGRLLSESVDGRTLDLAYDGLGRLTRRRTPSGSESRWTYDPAGNPTSLDADGHRVDFDHDAAGQETLRRLGSELRLAFVWDASYRLTDQTLSSTAATAIGPAPEHLLHRSYAFRADGNLTSFSGQTAGQSAEAVHYDLDPAGRVTAVRGGTWTEQYVYDRAGHPVAADLTTPQSQAGHGPRAYDGARLRTAGRLHYSYDAQGRVTARRSTTLSGRPSTWTYSWDVEDRLTDVTTPDGQHWHYRYDPLGRRIGKQHVVQETDDAQGLSAWERTHYTWHGPTLVEQTAQGPHLPGPYTLTWDYRGLHPIAQREQLASNASQDEIDRRFFAVVTDLIGTPTHLYAPDGTLAWQQRTTVWGTTVHSTASRTTTPLRLPGQYADPESGLHYNLHRYYDPATARYLSPDPLGPAPAPDPYGYVDNPLLWTDPLGLTAHCGTGTGDDPVTVYRAQSDHPLSQRLSVDSEGNVSIAGDQMLHLNMSGDISHSETFRGSGSRIIAFDVPRSFVDRVRASAVRQDEARGMSRRKWNIHSNGRPQVDDPTKGPDLYGIPANLFDPAWEHGDFSALLGAIIPGSGRVVR